MRRGFYPLVFLCFLLFGLTSAALIEDWGFYGHRRINRMAVFTLPQDLIGFYKKNIEYITEHAVDPDKRRYATKHEAVRHYIDIDHWGTYPFDEVPRNWTDALVQYTDIYIVNQRNDTFQVFGDRMVEEQGGNLILKNKTFARKFPGKVLKVSKKSYRDFFVKQILPQYYEDDWVVDLPAFQELLRNSGLTMKYQSVFAKDRFSEYGILPYHLVKMQSRLTKAFRDKNIKYILQLSADFGHYIGDAHVPLHTTENYNGQFTNQIGIHAFWESRLPELFADKEYSYFVGKARYIENPSKFYWDIVLTSHSYLDSVLLIEQDLKKIFPADQQFCYEERLERTIKTQCRAYAEAYHRRLDGQVERRMQGSIHAIGSAWYTAWVDAGQPDMKAMMDFKLSKKEKDQLEALNEKFKAGASKGRKHE